MSADWATLLRIADSRQIRQIGECDLRQRLGRVVRLFGSPADDPLGRDFEEGAFFPLPRIVFAEGFATVLGREPADCIDNTLVHVVRLGR